VKRNVAGGKGKQKKNAPPARKQLTRMAEVSRKEHQEGEKENNR
jgi:hypothetical protein